MRVNHWTWILCSGGDIEAAPAGTVSRLACFACRPVDTLAHFDDLISQELAVKVLSSLKSAKLRHRDCKIVRRRGKVFVICKSNPRFKARQR